LHDESWKAWFYYDEASPSFLTNRVDRLPKARAGEPAGYQREDGYWMVGHKGKNVLVHRIIYEITSGPIPSGYEVDHKDGDCSHNRDSNLRAVPKAVNQRNMKRDARNTSGKPGVSRTVVVRPKKDYHYWTASWVDAQGKKVNKHFSVNAHGEELARTKAEAARQEAIELLNATGLGYTERHGEEFDCSMQN
jgi:hypothetical protein